jgi:hypothetical protein
MEAEAYGFAAKDTKPPEIRTNLLNDPPLSIESISINEIAAELINHIRVRNIGQNSETDPLSRSWREFRTV